MAKRAGTESKSPPPKDAKIGDNSDGMVTPELYLTAVKEITAEKAKVKLANTAYKALRKKWGGNGIKLTVLDAMVTMADWTRDEIRDHFDVQARYAEWLGLPVAPGMQKQGDAFRGMTDDAIQAHEWHMTGRTYSRTGKPGRPPEECPEEFHQHFMRGFNEEDEQAWADAEDETPEVVEAKPDATVTQPSWANYDDDPENWFADQKRVFFEWFESLSVDDVPHISHPGVRAAFDAAVAAENKIDSEMAEASTADLEAVVVDEITDNDPLGVNDSAAADGAKGKGKPKLNVVH